jgi:hypothetical protein
MASRKGEWTHTGTSPPLYKLVYGIIISLAKLNYTIPPCGMGFGND